MTKQNYARTYIREWRKKRGLTLQQLADRLEVEPGGDLLVSYASLSRIETGNQPYSQPIIEAIARALNVSVSMLLEAHPERQGEVVDLFNHIPPERQAEAIQILRVLANTE
ncbi:helix-turn-helix domain-containing protein [Stappia sp. ES.058]|uniref:helix-turn-helix domain-containing protein n=1 Tax=Stappia sp. ES.058 TaxID=1881061 RepID=UPI00087B44C9|nr:helix-turn-helix transcriptional regulator [Stappia sp. ES.058]SDT96673.1 Helix-turn-helix domain-containing protein [Stappia sp. ES.058]